MFDLHDILQDRTACARYRAERDALAQRMEEVASEIDRTLLGVDGIEDAPAMRWARGLREALGSMHSPCHDLAGKVESLEEENEELRGMLNGIAFQLRLDDVHYYSGDNYDACQLEVLEKIESLRTAASSTSRGDASDVAMSASDLLPEEEREAIAWVRVHGGIAYVRDAWNVRSKLDRQLEKTQAKVERQQRHIMFVQRKCRERKHHIVELNKMVDEMRPRLVPEGMEWPRFEDGEPVRVGSDFGYGVKLHSYEVTSILFTSEGCFLEPDYSWEVDDYALRVKQGERVKRPAPKVLDADGAEIRVGDVLYRKSDGHMVKVAEVYEKTFIDADEYVCPGDGYTHRAPVFAADCRPLQEGETVWGTKGGGYHLTSVHDGKVFAHHVGGSFGAEVESAGGSGLYRLRADKLTHERPDSWDRLEEDASKQPYSYCVEHRLYIDPYDGCVTPTNELFARDLVRRARALAERDA